MACRSRRAACSPPTRSYRSQEGRRHRRHLVRPRSACCVRPTDDLDVTLNYFAQTDDIGGRRGQALGSDGFGRPYGEYESGSVQLEPSSRDLNIVSLEANMDLGFATLTSSTSYYEQNGDSISENTGFYAQAGFLPFYYNYPRPMASAVRQYGDEAFVQELRLVSDDGGNFDYVLGLYYQDQTRTSAQQSYLRGFQALVRRGGSACRLVHQRQRFPLQHGGRLHLQRHLRRTDLARHRSPRHHRRRARLRQRLREQLLLPGRPLHVLQPRPTPSTSRPTRATRCSGSTSPTTSTPITCSTQPSRKAIAAAAAIRCQRSAISAKPATPPRNLRRRTR